MVELLLSALGFLFLVAYADLKIRVATLERQIAALEGARVPAKAGPLARAAPVTAPTPAPPTAPAPRAAIPDPAPPPSAPSPPPPPRPKPLAPEPGPLAQATATLFGIVRANPFASVGVLLVLVGVGFLFTLLAASNILPPAVRVALLAAAGLAVFAFGTRQEASRPTFAMNLQGGAIALEFLCALWAHEGYGLVDAPAAFIWMGSLSAAAVGWAAWRRQGLFAFLGIAGSLLTPIAASTGAGTFSGLVGYCLWVAALGIGIGRFLRLPTLVGTTLAGVAALLGAGLGLTPGQVDASRIMLPLLLAGFLACALAWTRPRYLWDERQQAAIVALLVGAPVMTTGFLWAMANVDARGCALVLGAVTLVMLGWLRMASPHWQRWLLPIAGGLGLVALATGLEGPTRAISFSAATIGFVLIVRARPQRWLDGVAFIHWACAVLLALDETGRGAASSLFVAGLVALAAGFLTRGTQVSQPYTFLAPLALWYALRTGFDLSTTFDVLWCTGWALAAQGAGRALAWNELRLSAAWVVAGLAPLLLDDAHLAFDALVVRELSFGAWLAVCCVTIKRLNDASAHAARRRAAIEWASLAIPALVSGEIVRQLQHAQASPALIGAALAITWCGWCRLTALPRVKFDFHPRFAGAIGAILVTAHAAFAPLAPAPEALAWLALAALCHAAWRGGRDTHSTHDPRDRAAVGAVVAILAVATVLRLIGARYGLDSGAVALVFERTMQPWVSLLWAAVAIATVAAGTRGGARQLWMAGGIAIGVLIAKMLVVDLATFSLVAKVGVFMGTGVAFIALGRYCPVPPAENAP